MDLKSIGIVGFERILDKMNALLYISDPVTDELLYISPQMMQHFNLRDDAEIRHCWELLREGGGRCPFCPIPKLLRDPTRSHVWEETNEVTGGIYKNTDTLVEWDDGRLFHLHYREDVTDVRSAEAAFHRRLAQQELMFSLSQSFISTASMSTLIPNGLRMVGEFIQVSKVVLMRYDRVRGTLEASDYIWYGDGPDVYHPESISMPLEPGSITYRSFIDARLPYIACGDVVNSEDCSYAASHGIKSLLDIPIYVDGEYWGSLSFNECLRVREWSESDIQLARLIGNVISGAISRNRMEEKLVWAMERAKESSQAKGEFLSRMSHEIRTPLNAVIGMTKIARSSKDAARKEYCLEKIEEASVHLLGVINDILDMSKIEAKKFELSYTDFDFEAMLMRVVNVVTLRSNEKDQTLIVDMDENLRHSIVSDEQRLAQVIANLLSNAVKFTPEKGVIKLAVKKLDEADGVCNLQVTISDNGIGMNEEQQSRLFRSFEQADKSTSRNFGGTGLGLAISKSIVEMMEGRIWVESKPGKGSAFSFTIRTRRGSETLSRPALPTGWEGFRLLVLDESKEMRDYFSDFAQRFQVYCALAADAEEACRIAENALDVGARPPDIVFLDWVTCGAGAFELVRRIRAAVPNCCIVVVGSAYHWNDVEEEAYEAGVARFLPKPLFYSQIVDCINGCFGSGGRTDTGEEEAQAAPDDCYVGKRILLAEDIEVNREIVISMLEHTGMGIDCAENGRIAYEMFSENPGRYDLILMDIHMPEMDGYEATRRIRGIGSAAARDVPIVAMTANVFREDIERCLAAGMNEHISKPIDLTELYTKLRRILS